ncbi:hypothetical protein DGG96_09445 [Legionella qingyii]|uniref:Uncharacterized protein n=1 Tax=Legionella qingyii TaxID=2184757 RepID=A0A317U3L0_9GAMM|nr:hypothetical protein DGG96_09445 [Legionella qingyii]
MTDQITVVYIVNQLEDIERYLITLSQNVVYIRHVHHGIHVSKVSLDFVFYKNSVELKDEVDSVV